MEARFGLKTKSSVGGGGGGGSAARGLNDPGWGLGGRGDINGVLDDGKDL